MIKKEDEMAKGFDPDILAAMVKLQQLRRSGQLSHLKRIILNCCPQDRIRTIQREHRDEKIDLTSVT